MSEIKLITVKKPKAYASEAYKTLRTNIQFSSPDKKLKTIMVTSSCPGEGKTTTSSNLAITTAQAGSKTLLVDCDLRNPKLHKLFNVSNTIGLTDALIGNNRSQCNYQKTEIENLYILPSGTRPPNPAELLTSDRMKAYINSLKDTFDYIIIDTPPIIMVTDAQVISQYVDGTLLVIASGEIDRSAAIKAKELLETVNSKIIGVVLNKFDTKNAGYYGSYYGYYGEATDKKHIRKSEKEHKIKDNKINKNNKNKKRLEV